MIDTKPPRHFGLVPPAGNPVIGIANTGGSSSLRYAGYHTDFLDSGTSALALACLSAKRIEQGVGQSVRCEVIVPAYGCPDLLSAVHFAGLTPVLVDIQENYHGYDLVALEKAIGSQTLAILAVNFLGLPEQLAKLSEIAGRADQKIYLIEDNAQWLPEASLDSSSEAKLADALLFGDFVLTSFGRGKPLSLLGGGVLFTREEHLPALQGFHLQVIDSAENSSGQFQLKRRAYNLLLNPLFYRLLDSAPFLQLGATEYHQKHAISALPEKSEALLKSNLSSYLQRSRGIEQQWAAALNGTALKSAVELAPLTSGRMLRYPVLARSGEERECLIVALKRAGIGASPMYQRAMPEITGVSPDMYSLAGSTANAEKYAACLFTLPTHQGVTAQAIRRAKAVFSAV